MKIKFQHIIVLGMGLYISAFALAEVQVHLKEGGVINAQSVKFLGEIITLKMDGGSTSLHISKIDFIDAERTPPREVAEKQIQVQDEMNEPSQTTSDEDQVSHSTGTWQQASYMSGKSDNDSSPFSLNTKELTIRWSVKCPDGDAYLSATLRNAESAGYAASLLTTEEKEGQRRVRGNFDGQYYASVSSYSRCSWTFTVSELR